MLYYLSSWQMFEGWLSSVFLGISQQPSAEFLISPSAISYHCRSLHLTMCLHLLCLPPSMLFICVSWNHHSNNPDLIIGLTIDSTSGLNSLEYFLIFFNTLCPSNDPSRHLQDYCSTSVRLIMKARCSFWKIVLPMISAWYHLWP